MKASILLCAGAFLAVLATPSALASSNYTCTVVNYGTASSTRLTGINNKGQVVGVWANADESYLPHAFLRDADGTMTPLTAPNGSDEFTPVGINNLGQIAGQIVTATYPVFTASESFILNPDGSHTDIAPAVAPPGHTYSDPQITGINDKGELAGTINMDGPEVFLVFIRGTDGNYRTIDQVATTHLPVLGPFNNSDVMVRHGAGSGADGFLLQPDGSKLPLTYPGVPLYSEPLSTNTNGLNNKNVTAASLQLGQGFGGASVAFLRTLDGHYPDIACPEVGNLDLQLHGGTDLIEGLNDQNVVIGNYGLSGFIATPTGLWPHAEISNRSWTFSSHGVGETSGLGRIFLSNTGTADLHIPAMYFGNRSNGQTTYPSFQITRTDCGEWDADHQDMFNPGTIPPGGSCFVEFTFTPQTPGWQTAAIYIPNDSPTSPEVIQIGGTGIGSMLQVSNTSWTFAAHPVGETSGNGVIYAYNSGPGIITFQSSSHIVEPGGLANFRLLNNTCRSSLAPYTACAFTFNFTPGTPGEHAGYLDMTNNSTNGPEHIPLHGYAH